MTAVLARSRFEETNHVFVNYKVLLKQSPFPNVDGSSIVILF